jgi:hypothetical protein
MRRSTKIAFGISAVAMAGIIVYAASGAKTRKMLKQVSDEGYETAHDVLYPRNGRRGRKLRIGPVLPKK